MAALQLHATELLMLLGTAIVLLIERPAHPRTRPAVTDSTALEESPLPAHR
jgi:hypothetical protein